MIRAARVGRVADPSVVEEFVRLKDFLGVTPYLERLLASEMNDLLAGDPSPHRNVSALTDPSDGEALPKPARAGAGTAGPAAHPCRDHARR